MIKFLLLFVLSIFSSCATTSQESPSWLYSIYDKEYTKEEYICSVGEGLSVDKAYYNAVSMLASHFNISVNSSQLYKTFNESISHQEISNHSSNVNSILGIETLDTYFLNGRHYVRLGLNKAKTSILYENIVFTLSKELDLALDKAKDEKSIIASLKILEPLNSSIAELNNYLDQLKILQPINVINYEKKINDLKSNIVKNASFQIKGTASHLLNEIIENKNLSIRDDADNILSCDLEQNTSFVDGKTIVTFTLKLCLFDDFSTIKIEKTDRIITINELTAQNKFNSLINEIITLELGSYL